MIFPKRQDFLTPQTGLALGQTLQFDFTTDFHIAEIFIIVTAVGSGNIKTSSADGLLGLLKKATLQVSDGSQNRNPVDASGVGLLEYAMQTVGTLDRGTLAAKGVTAINGNTYRIVYPIMFQMPQLSDPVASVFLLPAPRFNSKPVLTLQLATQADLDTDVAPTAAFSSIRVDILVNRRQVGILKWPTYNTELQEIEVAYPATGADLLYEMQALGSYTMLGFRCYTSATARGDVSGGEFRLQLLGTALRRFRLADIQDENDRSLFNPSVGFSGSYWLDFLTDQAGGGQVGELGSVLDANITAGSGARLQLIQNITGGAAVKIRYMTHRVFGDIKNLKLAQ